MKSANNEKWEFSDDAWQFQTRSNTIILLSFRRTVIEAVYNKLNPYRSDDTVSIQTFFSATLLPLSFAWLGIRMPFGKWPASLTGCLHPLNKISKPNIFFVKLNDSKIEPEKSCRPVLRIVLWYLPCHLIIWQKLWYTAATFQYIKAYHQSLNHLYQSIFTPHRIWPYIRTKMYFFVTISWFY